MRRFVAFAVFCLMNAVAQAKGVPFAVESLEKAQQVSKQDSKHVLVFYTSEN